MKLLNILTFIGVCFFLSCDPPDYPVPVIKNVTPKQSVPGKSFDIKGDFLSFTDAVLLDTNKISDFAYYPDSNKIIVFIPENTEAKLYTLYLRTSHGRSNGVPFTVNPAPPYIEKLNPLSVSAGDTLQIEGKRFENSGLKVLIGNITIENFVSKSTTRLKFIIPTGAKSDSVTVSNVHGKSNTLYLNIGDKNRLVPIITSLDAYYGTVGSTFKVNGNNFEKGKLQITFPPSVLLAENIDYVVNSTTSLSITIPQGAVTGLVRIENSKGKAEFNFNVVTAPVIIRAIPESNKQGGPLLIFGKDLQYVSGINFGNTTITQFNKYHGGDNQDILSLAVPNIPAGNMKLSVQINKLVKSKEVPYTVKPGSMNLPNYLPAVVIPKSPPSHLLTDINNSWLWMGNTSRFQINQSNFGAVDYFVIQNASSDSIGYANVAGNYIEVQGYYGKMDSAYFDSEKNIKRIILTPIQEGNQIELIYPLYLEAVEPATVKLGDSLLFKVRYILDDDLFDYEIHVGDKVLFQNDITRIEPTNYLFKLKIGDDFPVGEKIRVFIGNPSDATRNTNSRFINIVSK